MYARLLVLGLVFGMIHSLRADDCYEFTQEQDQCVQLVDEDCGGGCVQNGSGQFSCEDPFQNWHVRQHSTATWDGVESAEQGYVADSIATITCGMIAECSCGDFLLFDGIPETCFVDNDDIQPYFDDQINVDINRSCPEVFPGGGGFFF